MTRPLTAEQAYMLSAFANGRTLGDIMNRLDISENDARAIERSIYLALGVANRGEAIQRHREMTKREIAA